MIGRLDDLEAIADANRFCGNPGGLNHNIGCRKRAIAAMSMRLYQPKWKRQLNSFKAARSLKRKQNPK